MKSEIKKLYYSIGEVSKMVELKSYVLRYWETEFKQLAPPKNRAGNRTYRQKDIDLITCRKILGKNKIIGVTCHNSKNLALKAKKHGSNYIAFGSFFKSSTKKFYLMEQILSLALVMFGKTKN